LEKPCLDAGQSNSQRVVLLIADTVANHWTVIVNDLSKQTTTEKIPTAASVFVVDETTFVNLGL
jgi:hypothetical protein